MRADPTTRPLLAGLLWAGVTALLVGCAAPAGLRALGSQASASEPAPHFGLLRLAGQDIETEWHLPGGSRGTTAEPIAEPTAQTPGEQGVEPTAWLLLQHGFARRCANLRHLGATLAREAGVATLCLNAEMAGGNPALAEALAHWLLSDAARSPDGRAAPPRLIVGGHSAGGAFAAQVGAHLATLRSAGPGLRAPGSTEAERGQGPDRLAGALLFDPVGGSAMGRALSAVSDQGRRPVLAVMAPASRCNAGQLGLEALRAVQASIRTTARPGSDYLGVVFAAGTHVDAEGPDTEAAAVLACREGWPQAAVVQALQALAAAWAKDMAMAPAIGAPAGAGAHGQAQRLLGDRVAWRVIE